MLHLELHALILLAANSSKVALHLYLHALMQLAATYPRSCCGSTCMHCYRLLLLVLGHVAP